jgi:16S rRNA (guanine(966)-N(2))-methyltransferase RsmD
MSNNRNNRNRRRGPRRDQARSGGKGGHPQRGKRQGSQPQGQANGGSQNLIRICGGEARGRLIRMPVGLGVRPTSEKVREALFDIIGPQVEGAVFYDIFAGTGAMGIEALSRGAERALFVESSRRVELVIRSNATGCGMAGRFDIWSGAFEDFIKQARESDLPRPTIVYLDPPYAIENHLDLIKGVSRARWHREDPELLVVMERPSRRAAFDPGDLPHPFRITDSRTYGDTSLVFFSARPAEEVPEPDSGTAESPKEA